MIHPALVEAVVHARELGKVHGWSSRIINGTVDALIEVLDCHPEDEPVTVTQVSERTPPGVSRRRVTQVLTDLGLLCDDTIPAIRVWIDRRSGELPAGFEADTRAWLLWLLNGDSRTRPRSQSSVYTYFGLVHPVLEGLAGTRDCLREVTHADLAAAVKSLEGHRLRNTVCALRSLFRFAKKHHRVFTDPARRLKAPNVRDIARVMLPMTDEEIKRVELTAATPAQRLMVALAAVHAARATPIRMLTLDDLDLPERRITIDGHNQRLGDLVYRLLREWLAHRRATWPNTANRHILISQRTALGIEPVTECYIKKQLLLRGVHLERVRSDRVLQEALAVGPDPLHLTVVFNFSLDTAMTFTKIASAILGIPPDSPTNLP